MQPLEEDNQVAISVSQAMQIAKAQLEGITVKVIGEISEYSSNPRYKAVYFTIKDERSSLPCMMWNNRFQACGLSIQVGSLVELVGRFTLYAAKGRMNFDVFSIELAGEGKLRLQVANLAKRLDAEGLMARVRKKAIPAFPEKIGLVTSPRGAAVYDVLRTLRRRFPSTKVVFAGVGVEGKNAPKDMEDALRTVQEAGAEVILLVRGGGSFEDLMPFNDEGLARAISSMDVPIVTGIGHEPDTSIADMVSDFRASTPTAAAEAVTVPSSEINAEISRDVEKMTRLLREVISKNAIMLRNISSKPIFSEPLRLFEEESRFLDDSLQRLSSAIPKQVADLKARLQTDAVMLKGGLKGATAPYRAALSTATASLSALSPLNVLTRGYSVSRDGEGKLLTSIHGIRPDNEMSVQLRDGIIDCVAKKVIAKECILEELDG